MNTLKHILMITSGIIVILYLSGCNENESSQPTTSYFKFYNASLNAGVHQLHSKESNSDDDFELQASIDFADVSLPISQYTASYDIAIKRQDASSDEEITIVNSNFSLSENKISLIALVGDAQQPELIELKYNSSSLEDLDPDEQKFEIYFANLSAYNNNLDIHYSKHDESFSDSIYLSALQYKNLSSLSVLNQGDYKFYLTHSGTNDIIFETNTVDLNSLDTFILIIRDDFGVNGLAIDKVTNSSYVTSYADDTTESSIQFYSSKENTSSYDIYLGGINNEPFLQNAAPGTISSAATLNPDTYTINSTMAHDQSHLLLSNLILDLDSDQSKTIIMYPDEQQVYQGIIVDKLRRELAYENSIRVVNIGQKDQKINVYFIASDKTLESADHKLKSVDYSAHRTITVLNEMYQIVVATEDDNDNLRSLFQSNFMSLKKNSNYLMILEPDTSSSSNFSLTILEE